jgi:hypothetical protein
MALSQNELLVGGIVVAGLMSHWLLPKIEDYPSNPFLLTARIKRKLLTECNQADLDIKDWIAQIYLPSWSSFVIIGLICGGLLTLAHNVKFPLDWIVQDDNHYQNLIAVHAGIGAIIFSLVIFIAETLRDSESKDKARVLLKESLLFPLTISEILVFFGFLWLKVGWLIVLPIVFVGLFSIFSISRLLLTLLSPSRYSRKRLQLFKDRIRRSISLAIKQRFGNNILLESLGQDKIELEYSWLSKKDERDYHIFYASKHGTVIDIRLDKLDEFAKRVEEESNKKGLSFYQKKPIVPASSSEDDTGSDETKNYKQAKGRYILKKYQDPVNQEYRGILAIARDLISEEALPELRVLAQRIFEIKKVDNSFSEEIIAELEGLKDPFLRAITEGQLTKVKSFKQDYLALAETFLELLNQCGGGYTYEQAKKEVWDEWSEIRWLKDSVREMVIKSAQSQDREVMREVFFLPMNIAVEAVKNKDHYLFRGFIWFPILVYDLALQQDKEDLREFMIERSLRYLEETNRFHIEYHFGDLDTETDFKQHGDFAVEVYRIFLALLKDSFEKRDFKNFDKFLSKLLDLNEHFDPEDDHPGVENLRWEIERAEGEAKKVLEEKLRLQTLKIKARHEITIRRKELVFGLASWILKKHRNDSNPILKKFFERIQSTLPSDLSELTSVFDSVHSFETATFWGFDDWGMIADGRAHSIDVHSGPERLYAISSLKLLRRKNPDQIHAIHLPHSRNLSYLADANSNLMKLLDEIAANPQNWVALLSNIEIAQIPHLKALLSQSKRDQEVADEEMIRDQTFSPVKITEFYKNFKEGYRERSTLRLLAEKFGIIEDKSESQELRPEISWIGYNQLDSKEGFFENWHVHYLDWGKQYGEGIANGENQTIFEDIANALTDSIEIEPKEFVSTITQRLHGQDVSDLIALGFRDFEFGEVYRRSDVFVPEWQARGENKLSGYEGIPFYMGYFKAGNGNLPVFRIGTRKLALRNTVIVVSLKDIGRWEQLPPINKPEDKPNQKGVFMLKISDLNLDDEVRNKILQQNPPWLQEHENPENYLRHKALIIAYEKFIFSILDPTKGFRISTPNQNLPSEDDDE